MINKLTAWLFILMGGIAIMTAGARQRESTEWVNITSYNANDNKLPRVLLVGDSICNQYQSFAKDELAGNAYVSFYATSKCVTDRSYLKELSYILEEYDYTVIHFNNGLHSLTTDPAEWEAGLRAAFKLLKEKGGNAKIIWVSSTPLKDPALTEKAKALNAIGARLAAENGFPVNDLFALMDPLDRSIYWADTYHFTNDGKKMQAKKVAAIIRAVLGTEKANVVAKAATDTGSDGKLGPAKSAVTTNAATNPQQNQGKH
ncbi:MAG: SGNH/GDSL hydrolase family protein [Kiritimatiellaeota bacterium]|nr:SGNH/GDSL hydrolase family protein [Kiritimatiellota bacterium]